MLAEACRLLAQSAKRPGCSILWHSIQAVASLGMARSILNSFALGTLAAKQLGLKKNRLPENRSGPKPRPKLLLIFSSQAPLKP